MKITKIEILINVKGTDQITLYTDMPNTFPQIPDQGNMKMDIDLQHGTAIEYVKKNFGNDSNFPATATVIDGKTGTIKHKYTVQIVKPERLEFFLMKNF